MPQEPPAIKVVRVSAESPDPRNTGKPLFPKMPDVVLDTNLDNPYGNDWNQAANAYYLQMWLHGLSSLLHANQVLAKLIADYNEVNRRKLTPYDQDWIKRMRTLIAQFQDIVADMDAILGASPHDGLRRQRVIDGLPPEDDLGSRFSDPARPGQVEPLAGKDNE